MVASQHMTGNEYRISYERQGDDLVSALQASPNRVQLIPSELIC